MTTADAGSPETDAARSALMGRVRQRGTKPELAVRAILSDLGVRYRLNVKSLPGSPDIANKAARRAVFVHGCFWHRHAGCSKTTTPTRNRQFWLDKFARNEERDVDNVRRLRSQGFRVLVVWECETRDTPRLRRRLREFWGERAA